MKLRLTPTRPRVVKGRLPPDATGCWRCIPGLFFFCQSRVYPQQTPGPGKPVVALQKLYVALYSAHEGASRLGEDECPTWETSDAPEPTAQFLGFLLQWSELPI